MKKYTFKDLIKKAENYGITERGKNIYTKERLAELIFDREIHKNPNVKLLAILEKKKKKKIIYSCRLDCVKDISYMRCALYICMSIFTGVCASVMIFGLVCVRNFRRRPSRSFFWPGLRICYLLAKPKGTLGLHSVRLSARPSVSLSVRRSVCQSIVSVPDVFPKC